MNPVYASTRIAAIARDPKWGGAVRRDHLRELLRCDRRTLDQAVGVAYRRYAIDICWGWIAAPATPAVSERAA